VSAIELALYQRSSRGAKGILSTISPRAAINILFLFVIIILLRMGSKKEGTSNNSKFVTPVKTGVQEYVSGSRLPSGRHLDSGWSLSRTCYGPGMTFLEAAKSHSMGKNILVALPNHLTISLCNTNGPIISRRLGSASPVQEAPFL